LLKFESCERRYLVACPPSNCSPEEQLQRLKKYRFKMD